MKVDEALQHEIKKVLIQKELEEDAKAILFHNKLGSTGRSARTAEGIGQYKGDVPAQAFHYWGQRLGYQCWRDPQFIKEYFRDNPELAIKHNSEKPFFVDQAIRTGRIKFRKVYGNEQQELGKHTPECCHS